MNEKQALLFLSRLPGIGAVKIRTLIAHFGSAKKALEADVSLIAGLPGFNKALAETIERGDKNSPNEEDLELADRDNVSIVSYIDPEYPKRLLDIPDYPVLLYMKGRLEVANQPGIAVVGTRTATIYGKEMAAKISRELPLYGLTVVSGLARGIDTAAHQGALVHGKTIAVIGSGLANIYPKENQKLAEKITEEGILISEFPMNTKPDRQNFPQRNRIVSGMTLGCLLIEAPQRSGAMITVDRALAQKRKIFTIPGRADHENFRGNHLIIKKGQAQLIENANDILQSFENLLPTPTKTPQKTNTLVLKPEEQLLIDLLPEQETSIEELTLRTKLPIPKLNVLLMSLVLKKVIKELPGKVYKRNF